MTQRRRKPAAKKRRKAPRARTYPDIRAAEIAGDSAPPRTPAKRRP